MSNIIRRSEFPKLSADPLQHIVDHGFPLHRFKNGSRFVKLFQESQVLPRTNDYRPTPIPSKKKIKSLWTKVTNSVTDLKDLLKDDILDMFIQDMHDKREFEIYDPLKGNSLIVSDYLDEFELYVFGAGASLSHLAILTSPKSSYDTGHYEVQLALDQMTIQDSIDLSYPIRQIQLSPLSTTSNIIFVVRTTSSIHLIKYDTSLTLVHQFILPEESELHTDIDYSMPIHAEPSPYYEYQYTFTTNNGYTALIDGLNDRILFDNVDSIPENVNYSSRWRSCGFGKTPTTIYAASPECIKEYTVRDKEIQTKILAAPNDRIVAFKTSHRFLYCFCTLDVMVVMDRFLPERPVVTWLHKMRDAPPTEIIFHQLENDNWRIIGFSPHTQKLTMMHFHYVNNPVRVIAPEVKVLELHNFTLPPLKFEEIYKFPNWINAAGFNIKTNMDGDLTKGNVLFSITRLFEDGSLRVQYMSLENEKLNTRVITPSPRYELSSISPSFNDIFIKSKKDMLPECIPNNGDHNEVCRVDMSKFKSYLENIHLGSKKLSDELKLNIAEKVRDLKSTTTFLELFNKSEYEDYTLDELTDFLGEMEVLEEIERARQIDIPGVFHISQPMNTTLREKLKSAHDKKIRLASLMIRPLRNSTTTFQYLDGDFKSTTTTKALADLWTIDENARYDSLPFPKLVTDRLLESEKFPCVSIYKREREDDLLLPPTITMTDDEEPELPEIPMPVVSASAPVKKKQKTTTAPVIVLSDDEQDNITPKSLALSLQQNSQPSTVSSSHLTPPSKYAVTSTQPLPGAFASRTKKPAVVKKKKKPKTSGFK